ncbi:MAG: hypothetical protein MJA27_05550 [Pseudanabaenales cyanobacterium]|nr:hypothetical protein [Pseudanabaenales cyanobacterium]
MMSDVEFALFLIYFAIGIVTTVSVDALAIALIDEDAYGISDHAPSSGDWEALLWKSLLVVLSPVALAAFMAMHVVGWMSKRMRMPKKIPITPVIIEPAFYGRKSL